MSFDASRKVPSIVGVEDRILRSISEAFVTLSNMYALTVSDGHDARGTRWSPLNRGNNSISIRKKLSCRNNAALLL